MTPAPETSGQARCNSCGHEAPAAEMTPELKFNWEPLRADMARFLAAFGPPDELGMCRASVSAATLARWRSWWRAGGSTEGKPAVLPWAQETAPLTQVWAVPGAWEGEGM